MKASFQAGAKNLHKSCLRFHLLTTDLISAGDMIPEPFRAPDFYCLFMVAFELLEPAAVAFLP